MKYAMLTENNKDGASVCSPASTPKDSTTLNETKGGGGGDGGVKSGRHPLLFKMLIDQDMHANSMGELKLYKNRCKTTTDAGFFAISRNLKDNNNSSLVDQEKTTSVSSAGVDVDDIILPLNDFDLNDDDIEEKDDEEDEGDEDGEEESPAIVVVERMIGNSNDNNNRKRKVVSAE